MQKQYRRMIENVEKRQSCGIWAFSLDFGCRLLEDEARNLFLLISSFFKFPFAVYF